LEPRAVQGSERDAHPRLGLDHGTGRGIGLGRAVGALREAAVRGSLRAGGYLVSPTIARLWAKQGPGLRDVPGFAEHFMPNGRAPAAGEKFVAPAHAKALQRIAQTKGEAFYRGELAEKMVTHSRRHGGAFSLDDFATHTADWVDTLALDYRGQTLHEIPPNGQAIAAQMALALLQRL